MKVVEYHGTSVNFRYSIEKDGLDPQKCRYRNNHWLGQGVYFFDDYDKALWWAKIISSYNSDCGALIYKSCIEAIDEEVLDLDDNNQLDLFLTVIMDTLNEVENECIGEMPQFTTETFKAVFFDYYKQTYNISVIIATFQKDVVKYMTRRSTEGIKQQKAILNNIGIYFKEKQICVSKKECINSTKLVYNEEEEVI